MMYLTRRVFMLCSVVVVATIVPGCFERAGDIIEQTIEGIGEQYAPDRRTEVFDVEHAIRGNRILVRGELTSSAARKALLDSLNKAGFEVIDSIRHLPDVALGKDTLGLVRLSVCNIRGEPRHSAELVTQELMGQPLRILKRDGNWFYIQTPNQYIGWVDSAAVSLNDPADLEAWNRRPKVIFTEVFGKILDRPSPDATMVSDIVAGAIVALDTTYDDGSYTAIYLPDGRHGFIPAATIVSEDSIAAHRAATGAGILMTAKQFLGIPYLWGGTSAKGFDCSGYTKIVYGLHGISLARDASQQVLQGTDLGTDLDFETLCPGDLLFFGRLTDEGREKVTHVAIHMGGGKVIHAAGEVQIQSLRPEDENFAPDRRRTFLRARRILAGNCGE